MGLFRRGGAAGSVRVRVLIKGRIGDGWFDVDRTLKVPAGTTLTGFIALAARKGVPLDRAVAESPHLRHTLMWNGDRCPVDEHAERELADGDELYLLAPLAGG
ncbi:MAG: MoaD/ThiS family protein [Myxococcales bacterium]|nr:MoaD/ThiS family protein [Myxococcales bacterium]